MTPSIIIATSRYQNQDLIIESKLAPVRITLGKPRLPLRYELAGEVRDLAPPPWLFKVDEREEFTRKFTRYLDRNVTPAQCERWLAKIANKAKAPGVVLLCFEDVFLPGEWCHRRVMADWWRAHTGRYLPELGSEYGAGRTLAHPPFIDPLTGEIIGELA